MSFLDRVRSAAEPRALGALVQRSLKHSDRSRGVYPALGELARRYGDAPDLTASELRVFSQNGEDGVIAEILRRIGTGGGGFVEFGIQDGTEGNTVFLAQVLGWSGVYLEADERELRGARAAGYSRQPARALRCMRRSEGRTRSRRCSRGPAYRRSPTSVSIDVDGNDYWIWARAGRPSGRGLVIVEYNGGVRPRPRGAWVPYTPGFRWERHERLRVLARRARGARAGGRATGSCTRSWRACDTFFVREDLAGGLPSGDAVPRRSGNHALMGLGHPRPRTEPGW